MNAGGHLQGVALGRAAHGHRLAGGEDDLLGRVVHRVVGTLGAAGDAKPRALQAPGARLGGRAAVRAG